MKFVNIITLLLSSSLTPSVEAQEKRPSCPQPDECNNLEFILTEGAIELMESHRNIDVVNFVCNPIQREMVVDWTKRTNEDDADRCSKVIKRLKRKLKKENNDALQSLRRNRDCEMEVRKELRVLRTLDRNTINHTRVFPLIPILVGTGISLVGLSAGGVSNYLLGGGKDGGSGKRRRLRDRKGVTDVVEVNNEPFVAPSDLASKCNMTDYDVALIVTPGPHSVLGAKPVDTASECPILAFDSNHFLNTKAMHIIPESETWGTFNNDPMYDLGVANLQDILNAFKAATDMKQGKFDIKGSNCFDFSKAMWRKLDIQENESLLEFLVEEIVKDKNIYRMLKASGKEVSDYADKESLRELIYDVAISQLDIQAH